MPRGLRHAVQQSSGSDGTYWNCCEQEAPVCDFRASASCSGIFLCRSVPVPYVSALGFMIRGLAASGGDLCQDQLLIHDANASPCCRCGWV